MFYGANPDAREDFAKEMELPESRADYCDAEYDLAAKSWIAILDSVRDGEGQKISFRDKSRNPLGKVVAESLSQLLADFNADFSLPGQLEVFLKKCGSEDRGYEAFYSEYFEGEGSITVCTEYVRELYQIASGEL